MLKAHLIQLRSSWRWVWFKYYRYEQALNLRATLHIAPPQMLVVEPLLTFHRYNGPHLSLVCLECHMKGGFAAGFTMKVELNPFHGQKGCDKKNSPRKRSPAATAFLDEHEDIQPLIYAVMEAERIKAHQQVVRKVHKLRKRGLSLPKLDHPKCSPEDPTYPVCHEKQIPRALLDADPCNPLLHPVKAAASGLKCALKSIFSLGINGKRCRRKAKEAMKEFKGLKDYAKQFIKAHVSDMEIFFEVVEEIDVKFQLELAGTVALTFWFDLDFLQQEFKVFDGKCTPIPEAPLFCWQPALPIKPSFGWFFSLDGGSPTGPVPLSGLPSGSKDDKGKHVSIGSKMGSAKSSRDASVDSKKDGPGSVTEDPSGDAMHGLPVPTLDITPVGLSMSLAMEAHMNVYLSRGRVTEPACLSKLTSCKERFQVSKSLCHKANSSGNPCSKTRPIDSKTASR